MSSGTRQPGRARMGRRDDARQKTSIEMNEDYDNPHSHSHSHSYPHSHSHLTRSRTRIPTTTVLTRGGVPVRQETKTQRRQGRDQRYTGYPPSPSASATGSLNSATRVSRPLSAESGQVSSAGRRGRGRGREMTIGRLPGPVSALPSDLKQSRHRTSLPPGTQTTTRSGLRSSARLTSTGRGMEAKTQHAQLSSQARQSLGKQKQYHKQQQQHQHQHLNEEIQDEEGYGLAIEKEQEWEDEDNEEDVEEENEQEYSQFSTSQMRGSGSSIPTHRSAITTEGSTHYSPQDEDQRGEQQQQQHYPKEIVFQMLVWTFGTPLEPVFTGPYQWSFIHTLSLINTGNAQKQAEFVTIILTNLSCLTCFQGMRASMARNPFDVTEAIRVGKESKDNNLYCVRWWINLHNEVNSRNEKPAIPFEAARNHWLLQYRANPRKFLRALTIFWHFCAQYQLTNATRAKRKKTKAYVSSETEEKALEVYRMLPLARFVNFILNDNFLPNTPEANALIEECKKVELENVKYYFPDRPGDPFSGDRFNGALYGIEQRLWRAPSLAKSSMMPPVTRQHYYRLAEENQTIYWV